MSLAYVIIPVLPHLVGKPWEPITGCYLSTLRPSDVRVYELDDEPCIKTDALLWRVTVYLSGGIVDHIEQEVEIDLSGVVFRNGYEIERALDRLEKKIELGTAGAKPEKRSCPLPLPLAPCSVCD